MLYTICYLVKFLLYSSVKFQFKCASVHGFVQTYILIHIRIISQVWLIIMPEAVERWFHAGSYILKV